MARSCEAKFIETSAGIEHNVDELLVGVLKQIRLRIEQAKMSTSNKKKTEETIDASVVRVCNPGALALGVMTSQGNFPLKTQRACF